MEHCIETIKASSRQLLEQEELSCPVRKLASAVYHGAELIDLHRLDSTHALPQFERALFHLCHVVHRHLCQQPICDLEVGSEAQRCSRATSHRH